MTVQLTAEDQAYIDEQVRTGRYTSAEAVIRDALGLLRITPRSVPQLQEMVDAGLASLDRGEGKPWNAQAFLDEMDRRHPAK